MSATELIKGPPDRSDRELQRAAVSVPVSGRGADRADALVRCGDWEARTRPGAGGVRTETAETIRGNS